jgi:SAM-dependent methyltransferase
MTEKPNAISATEDFEFAALQKAEKYRAALVLEFLPFLKGNVIEIGAGVGQFTRAFTALPSIQRLVSVEPEPRFCQVFKKLMPKHTLFEGTIDVLSPDDEWDAIVSINVLEHIREDGAELVKYRERLGRRRGHLCLFVPARPEIYAPIDKDFGHHRRYTRPQLRQTLKAAGFSIVRLNYFNWVGYFAWWLNFCVLKKRHFDVGSVLFFDRFVFPIVHMLEYNVLRPPFGQSLLAVAQAE